MHTFVHSGATIQRQQPHTTASCMQKHCRITPTCSGRSSDTWQWQTGTGLLFCCARVNVQLYKHCRGSFWLQRWWLYSETIVVIVVRVAWNSRTFWQGVHRQKLQTAGCRVYQERKFLIHVPRIYVSIEQYAIYDPLSLVSGMTDTANSQPSALNLQSSGLAWFYWSNSVNFLQCHHMWQKSLIILKWNSNDNRQRKTCDVIAQKCTR